jgi:hypothetical protein
VVKLPYGGRNLQETDMTGRIALALIAAALVLPGAATAQTTDQDVRCLLASNLFVKAEKDQARKQIAVFASYFYLGRVDARLSGSQLTAALKAQGAAINPQNAGPTMTACAKRLQGASLAIQTIGKQLAGPAPK